MKLIIIGAGPAGYTAAFSAADAGIETTLIEQDVLGGTCLHAGCIPTKTLRATACILDYAARFKEFGLTGGSAPAPDMPAISARKERVISVLEGGLGKTAAAKGVCLMRGTASLAGDKAIRVSGPDGTKDLRGDAVVIAAGAMPLDLPGLTPDHERILSSADALNLKQVPQHLLIVGGGVIGCELAQIYRSFGAKVTLVEGQGRLLPLPSVDAEISRMLLREMKKKGIAVETGRTVFSIKQEKEDLVVTIGPTDRNAAPQPRDIVVSHVCVTIGRKPRADGLNLADAGIHTDERGWITVNDFLETSAPGVYAVGDILGPRHVMLAHMAEAEARTAVHNILHPDALRAQRYEVVPSAIFTVPEIGEVGLTEEQAKETGLRIRTSIVQTRELGKAQAMGELAGFFKIIMEEGTGRLLGAHIAGAHASDLIAEAALALRKGCTAADLAQTIHAHPTLAEGLKEAATR